MMPVQMLRTATVITGALIALLLAATPAAGYVYWSQSADGTIGRANLDGSGVNNSFITVPAAPDGKSNPCGLAINAANVYWASCAGGTTLGRASIEGAAPENDFISGANNLCGVALNSSFIYWDGDGGEQLGRATLEGSGVEQNFIPEGDAACGVAVNGSYIYWANYKTSLIGRANLNGSEVDPDFINATGASGLAINEAYIYWGESNGSAIGRANLNGSEVDNGFITGVDNSSGVAVNASYIYWNNADGYIGCANLNGSGANQDFINAGPGVFNVAVNSLGPEGACPTVSTPSEPVPTPSEAVSTPSTSPVPVVAPAPALAKTALVQAITGTVLVRLPGHNHFETLQSSADIPIGAEIEATHGSVTFEVARLSGGTSTVTVSGGRFLITQSLRSGITTFTLTQPLTGCPSMVTSKKSALDARRKKRKGPTHRHITVTETAGGFATKGQYVATSVEGTTWTTADACTSSTVSVEKGVVRVTDLVRHKTFTLRTGQSYTAHRGRR
jgi:hypothetical protein